MPHLLEINNLSVKVGDKPILKDLNLKVNAGEVHALMGPNGSGKSTLASTLAGHTDYVITEGSICFNGQEITQAKPEERSLLGLYLAWQYPVSIPGLSVEEFLRTAVNIHRQNASEPELSPSEFRQLLERLMIELKFNPDLIQRGLNDGFSGGEKKRLEVLQLMLLRPKLAILDETDSGLDIDAMKVVAQGIGALTRQKVAVILITHYQRMLYYIKPEVVEVLVDGEIVCLGGAELVGAIEANGYEQFIKPRNQ